MCLLDLLFHFHLNPIASTWSFTAWTHVATMPDGPTSVLGGLSGCTCLPVGVICLVNASAFATTFPGISPLQKERLVATSNLTGAYSIARISTGFANSAMNPPALPVDIICRASLCCLSAYLQRRSPTEFRLPRSDNTLKYAIPNTFKPSSVSLS